MKKIKVSFIAMLAIVMAIGLSSFSLIQKRDATVWFTLKSGDPSIAANYELAGGNGSDPSCSPVPADVCAIRANDDGNGNPVQSELDDITSQSNNFQSAHNDVEYVP